MLRLRPKAIYNLQQKVHKGREEQCDNIIQVKNVSSAAHTSGESRGGHIRINKAEGAPRTCKKIPIHDRRREYKILITTEIYENIKTPRCERALMEYPCRKYGYSRVVRSVYRIRGLASHRKLLSAGKL